MTTKNPLLFIAIGFVVAGFGFFHFVLQPKQKQASDLSAKIDAAQSDLDAAHSLLASNTEAKKSYRSSYTQVVRLGKAVPGDDDVRSLVVQLDQAAKATHVDFESIDLGDASGAAAAPSTSATPTGSGAALPPGATVGPAGFPIMPFSFTFKGQFFRLGAFFHRLDEFVKATNDQVRVSGRLLTVTGIKLEPDTTGFPDIKATVSATTYLVSPVEGATGGATVATPGGAGSTSAPGGTSAGTTTPPTTTATSTGAIR